MQQLVSDSLALAVLRRLADGEFHSGTQIAAELGFSRARIWQAVEECAGLGVEVFRVPGRGYRLAAPLCLLDARAVATKSPATGWRLQIVDRLDSTNTALAHWASSRDVHGEALAAEIQSAGRGRLGRSWHSVIGGSLTFSVAWRFHQGLAALSGLSLAVGL